jgi:hypothetical protein
MEENRNDYVCYTRFIRDGRQQWSDWEEGQDYHLTLILRYFSQPIRDSPVMITITFEGGHSGIYHCSGRRCNNSILVRRHDLTRTPFHILFCRRENAEETLASHSRP